MRGESRRRVCLALLGLVALVTSLIAYTPRLTPPPDRREHSAKVALATQRPKPIQVIPTPPPHPVPPEKAPATRRSEGAPVLVSNFSGLPALLHKVAPGESLGAITYRYLPQTIFMTSGELEAAIRKANPDWKGTRVRPGQELVIPGAETAPIVERPVLKSKNTELRAIYLTGLMAGSSQGLSIIRRWQELGGNAVVFDVKDMDGIVSFPFEHPLAPRTRRPYIRNLPKFTRFLHRMGLHVIARIALFRDEYLATRFAEYAVRSRRTGQAWRENGKQVWVDPSRREVQDYNLALARAAAAAGVDEIQFDYVRFPAEGDQADAQFHFQSAPPERTRAQVISGFLERAYHELHPLGVLVSLDVFGVMGWQRPVDLGHTGQDIPEMARFCDVLSPMIYPSHFFGMDGFERPGDAPEHFISSSMKRFREITGTTDVVLRPWLQAFGWRTKTYSPAYVRTQIAVANQHGGIGYLFWNARNDYSAAFRALSEMRPMPEPLRAGEKAEARPPAIKTRFSTPPGVRDPEGPATVARQAPAARTDSAIPSATASQ